MQKGRDRNGVTRYRGAEYVIESGGAARYARRRVLELLPVDGWVIGRDAGRVCVLWQ